MIYLAALLLVVLFVLVLYRRGKQREAREAAIAALRRGRLTPLNMSHAAFNGSLRARGYNPRASA